MTIEDRQLSPRKGQDLQEPAPQSGQESQVIAPIPTKYISTLGIFAVIEEEKPSSCTLELTVVEPFENSQSSISFECVLPHDGSAKLSFPIFVSALRRSVQTHMRCLSPNTATAAEAVLPSLTFLAQQTPSIWETTEQILGAHRSPLRKS